ncbi:hypothetical protein F1880_005545 [Penicillium rolfsii]|nr:hypothetical protein F1880_005545 [Penicillium rolfsii]
MAKKRGRCGSGSSHWDSGSDEESAERSIVSTDLTDMSRCSDSTENLEVICDRQTEAETLQADRGFAEDLPASVTVPDRQADFDEVSLGDFAHLLQLKEQQNTPLKKALSIDRGYMSLCEPEPEPELVEFNQDPESTHAGQAIDDLVEIEPDQIPYSPSKATPGRNFLSGKTKKKLNREELSEYAPLNLKIPAHARAKSTRRSLESIEPILDRKAKLPLGPADVPQNQQRKE